MGRFIVLGERARVASYVLAGAEVLVAEEPDAVRRAWAHLPVAAAVVILTPMASRALIGATAPNDLLVIAMPA